LTASDNTINAPILSGFVLNSFNTSQFTATLSNNTVSNAGSNGIASESYNGSTINLTATSNIITLPLNNGIYVGAHNNNSKIFAVLDGNAILDAGGNGIFAQKFTVPSTITINGTVSNTVSGSGSGLSFHSVLNPTGTFILNGVSIPASADVP
jgi:hypothetical protein